ncbi:spore germination protein GerPC [Sulfoacidibacillus thermotolerans]|uniref:Uncharacterized protein n=1 Tax=Sulfoacidibacillus thermotolerans TaxID=1765684 RepID=A0A2U3D904_SULT2|nr:spore germination protein GerPC [Sulfoacidibacillus thermotolerans]PWI57759.1 hypothetical protein BM613_07200 [Sulfoacidibacillus thermotolerans]
MDEDGFLYQEIAREWYDRVRILEREVATLKAIVRTLKHQKIEYRIDQLHIESLEGILNIGISAYDEEAQHDLLADLQAGRTSSSEPSD